MNTSPNELTRLITACYVNPGVAISEFEDLRWNRAQAVMIDHYWSGEPAPASRHAEARLLWSAEGLHVRFVCNQSEPLIISDHPQTDRKTRGLWDRDVCEIFIAHDPRVVESYLEIEAAPTGEWLDVGVDWTSGKRESNWEIESQMRTSARIEPDRLIIAMTIPWIALPKPQAGDRWRINLLRCVGKDPDRGYLAWQPTLASEPNFHVPEVFGWLKFS